MRTLVVLVLALGCGCSERSERPTVARVHALHADCASDDAPDHDRDGDPPIAFGGGDCDDDDPTVHRGAGCRVSVDCAHLRAAELAKLAPSGTIDLAFGADCAAWLVTAGGAVVVLDRTGAIVQTWHADAAPTDTRGSSDGASVVVGPDGGWFVAEAGRVLEVDPATGRTRTHAIVSAEVVDLAFDVDGTLYVEHTGDAIEAFVSDGARRRLASVTGEGRLAIAPDGWLVRLVPETGAFQEWALDQ